MADDKQLKLKEVTQWEVFTPKAAKRVNTRLTNYAYLNTSAQG